MRPKIGLASPALEGSASRTEGEAWRAGEEGGCVDAVPAFGVAEGVTKAFLFWGKSAGMKTICKQYVK